jgi:hypothetical protein
MSEEFIKEPLKQKRKKKERLGSYDAHLHRQFHGDEPVWTGVKTTDEGYNIKISRALNWASSSFDSATFKKITLEYIAGDKKYEFVKEMPDYHFIGALGPQAWLRMNKAPVTEESNKFFKDSLDNLKQKYDKMIEEQQKELEAVSILGTELSLDQKANIEHANFGAQLDNMILKDEIDSDKVYDLIRNKTPSQTALRLLLDRYKGNVEDCDDYSSKNKLKGVVKKYNGQLRTGSYSIVTVLEKILSNVRAENKLNKLRKPRKRKIKPAQMQVKNLKFKENDMSLKLVSIPPVTVVSAPTLITFNTKNRKVSIFYAKNTDGLTIKGTTVLNYDAERSKQKTIRKPEEMIEHLIGTSLLRFEKVFEGIKAKQSTPTGRINEDTMLLKVFKI